MEITTLGKEWHTYRDQAKTLIQNTPFTSGSKTPLQEACSYALLNGGKRVRPAVVLMVAKALGKEMDVSRAALGVEYFHTASLAADDLPCMDDEDERRQKPSVHKVYGEAVALLVSYALIAAGYEKIAENAGLLKQTHPSINWDERAVFALENATFNTGINGATGGQFLDISPPDLTVETVRQVMHQKTTSLFEIAFVFGWLFGGGDLAGLDGVKKVASHYGAAFQIADDISDREEDRKNKRLVNLANIIGLEGALEMFHVERQNYLRELKELGIATPALLGLLPEQVCSPSIAK